jgi:hypothetical protein
MFCYHQRLIAINWIEKFRNSFVTIVRKQVFCLAKAKYTCICLHIFHMHRGKDKVPTTVNWFYFHKAKSTQTYTICRICPHVWSPILWNCSIVLRVSSTGRRANFILARNRWSINCLPSMKLKSNLITCLQTTHHCYCLVYSILIFY